MTTAGRAAPGPSRDLQIALVIAALFLSLSLNMFWGRAAPDLAPTWFAAKFFAEGELGQIYPDTGPVFTATTPPSWSDMAARSGHDSLILAYIYPPLWAALVAPLTGLTSLAAFQNAVLVLNHLALLGILLLARRIASRGVPVALYLGVGLVILMSGPFAALALFQNQPQIIVGYLTLLAIERTRAGAPLVAGAVLGLAVALKVAPVLLLPALLIAGDWRRCLAGFVAVGAGLGLMSLALAGWQVHAAFLSALSKISGSVVLSDAAYTLDALAVQFVAPEAMIHITTGGNGGPNSGWWVMAKPPLWRAVSDALMLVATVLPVLAIRRGAGAFVWPAALIVLGLAGSIAWSFYFIAPLAFLPALAGRLGPVRGTVAALGLALPGSYVALSLVRGALPVPYPDQMLGVATLAVTATIFALAARVPDQGLRPPTAQV